MSGGFTRGCLFLLEGNPGTGKTTMAHRFLLEGAASGERNLYVTLSETKSELLNGAASHGWTLDSNIEVFELQPAENMLDADPMTLDADIFGGEKIEIVLQVHDELHLPRHRSS